MKLHLWHVIVLISTIALFIDANANAEAVPHLEDYLAVSQAEECAVVRSLVAKAKAKLEESRHALGQHVSDLKSRRSELESCARKNGIRGLKDPRDKALAAELCPVAFNAWLRPGYGRMVSQQDLFETETQLHRLSWHLEMYCRRAPRGAVVADKQ